VDALLQAKAELAAHFEHADKSTARTVQRLEAILFDPKIDEAMGVLVPGSQGPSLIPADEEHHKEDA
jgi:hypothetical protein